MNATLTVIETGRLNDLERRIEAFRTAFIDAGEALREIRDGRLYRTAHATFEDYCETRWALKKAHAYRLIAAVECIEAIKRSPVGDLLPATERQCRELLKDEAPQAPAVIN